MSDSSAARPEKRGLFARFLDLVEWLGNLLPHPVTLFVVIDLLILLASGLAGWLDWSVVDPRPEGVPGRAPDGMARAMSSMGLYLVLVFFAAQFVAWFKWTNLGPITAVVGADLLRDIGLTEPAVFVPFILMCCCVNLMLGSASAQWSVTAPIFVPVLMMLGYSPQVVQAAYRIGDSTTNTITPMMSYFGLILAFAMRYDRKLGIGTLVATMLPYSIAFLIGWVLLFYLWVFGLGLPVGPGTPTRIDLAM